MRLLEAKDFLAESEALYSAVAKLSGQDFQKFTQFKGWTLNDVFVHLHFWNLAVDQTVEDPDTFNKLVPKVEEALQQKGGLRALENAAVAQRGIELRDTWIKLARNMEPRWRLLDPKKRLPWVGPSMSARSAITARQMETWAHGFEIFDALGLERMNTDRIRNIVVLGINTFGWSHQVHGLPIPELLPKIRLTAPSGAEWEFGDEAAGSVSGPAVDFAAVVTQTRALADTQLKVEGAVANTWMSHAQCFAGFAEIPPAPGSRFKAA